METIRKKINLEDARIRLSGCTIPIISGYEDSLGNIYSDISGSSKYIRVKTEAREYNKLLNIIRNGIKIKKKSNLSDCTGVGSESVYILTDEFDILPISCGSYNLGYGVYSVDYFDKISDTEYETHRPEIREDVVVLINNIEEFDRLGGLDKIIEAYQYLFCGRTDGGAYVSPYVELPILLNQDIADVGHMTDYQDDFVDEIGEPIGLFPNLDGVSVDTKFRTDIPNPLSASTVGGLSGFTTDSKLQFLRSKTIYTDDDGNVLPGLYSSVSANTFFRYTYHPASETFTIARHDAASGFTCGDGEQLIPGAQIYRTASIPETAKRFLIENEAADGTYYFLIKNQNSGISKYMMDIPFVANPDGQGNRVISIDSSTTEGYIIIGYEYNGVTYEETYKYDTGQTMTINLDGFENIDIYYNKIDYEFTQQTIYNKHYGVEREGNLADIIGYNVADVWGKDGSMSEYTVNTPIFKEEYLLGISSAFESEVDVTIDRGNAAAFERHFKLSECNTMEDLENYGNNYFNL